MNSGTVERSKSPRADRTTVHSFRRAIHGAASGSIPRRSFTAHRSFCLHPRRGTSPKPRSVSPWHSARSQRRRSAPMRGQMQGGISRPRC